ncbi:hypothetical protein Celal_4007 [Cellulophaga algicola DSM 14237]|uniref:Lipoprotein n=1 Tax=Cellulophaga algicola (strain DSM 14237 / IC166 / ACAM 630) TaxID=688270 RepID=E6XD64_CELAD|nr:hypothetical protein [Cellulophaga algicola]ADV51251.1 hypothetical protein Celal_4007 [Cellulophaga algicola DSM 14237]
MIKIKYSIPLLALMFSFIGCDNNDDETTPTTVPTDGFTYNTTFYETANTYIDIDDCDSDNDGMPDSYTFFFTDGRMFDNDDNVNGSSGDYLYSLNTTKLVFLNVLVSDNPGLANTGIVAGNTYIVSSTEDSVIIHDAQIDALSPSFIVNSVAFGMGNENIGTFHLPGTVVPTITINTFNFDLSDLENSIIDADYTFMNTSGEVITGHYTGTYGVLLD